MSWVWKGGSGDPDLRAVDRLHNAYLNLLAAMDNVHLTCAKYFLALRATTSSHDAVQEFRTACQRVAEHITRVTESWDHVVADLLEYLPLRPLERLEQLLSSISSSYNHYPTQRNKVLVILPSLRGSAQCQAAVIKDLYEELEKDIMFIEAERRAADLPQTNLNVALAALIWHEWGLAQHREDMHFARLWDWHGGPSDLDTTNLINGPHKDET
ncbi:hypothetical protein FB45DRAFT_949348 [Roridomyces roridus]|uniref:Uncharacterized protein n=1 Tax=Roridomyces roridus TaxID=1738132 RepID=A0AAD7FA94_9AGAR|nr:hypothetical protein FB45DRAFT_949348 [Roridomyces roridus]